MRFIRSIRMKLWLRGQTMTEYALILAAIAIVVYATYEAMGSDIGTFVNSLGSQLTAS
jgi:Flp pilus assembly pilin Flp